MKIKSILFSLLLSAGFSLYAQVKVEKWSVFELTFKGPIDGNPFIDTRLSADFIHENDTVLVQGFYDGKGIYKVRFMPSEEGKWNYLTSSNVKELHKKNGNFICIPPLNGNHGPVAVKDTFYFAYADGSPYYPFGTTCYAWVHQGDSLADVTIKTLSKRYFNKMRMCIFPKSYDWNNNEPKLYPFEGTPLKNWNFNKLNPAFFRNIEKRIKQLDSLGIQADLIVFHPYDRWGFSSMNRTTDDIYIKYIIARFSAYKNVWWSMANEWDFMGEKSVIDFDHYVDLFAKEDKYHHLLGIHNGAKWYDHTNPLITHASIQSEDTYKANEYRNKYNKPIVFDECRYEGNIQWSWGNLTAKTMTEKIWRGVINGGYVGHGETYATENPLTFPDKSTDILWWSKGGELKGESPARIKFLREIIESAPPYLKPTPLYASWMPFAAIGKGNDYYLAYLNDAQPRFTIIDLPQNSLYQVEIIDTWNMTITPIEKKFSGHSLIELPQKPYIALKIIKLK
jgi:hypothetical protein